MSMSSVAGLPAIEVEVIPLTLLRPGQSGTVDQVLGAGDLVHRLREMGLRGGAEVEMIRPGSPCMIRLEGHTLGIRSDELAGILVRPRG